MEPFALLKMCETLCTDKKIVLRWLVTDDDSSIEAKMKWSNADHMPKHGLTKPPTTINSKGNEVTHPDAGGVPIDMLEPGFCADAHAGDDAKAAQIARDACECDVLDSLSLDGSEFFDCDTFGDDEDVVSPTVDCDKENAF